MSFAISGKRPAQLKRPAQASPCMHEYELTHDGAEWSHQDVVRHVREWAGGGPKHVKLAMSKAKCAWSGWATYKPARRNISIPCTPASHHTDPEKSLGEESIS